MIGHGLGLIHPSDFVHEEKHPLRLRGAVASVEKYLDLPYQWRPRYDQGNEGACVGYSLSWAMSILNGQFYDADWLYREAQHIDEWPGTDYSGTSLRAGCDVLRKIGHRRKHDPRHTHEPRFVHGIEANTWARSVDDIRTCIARGVPVVLGTDWMSGFTYPEHRGHHDDWIGTGNIGTVIGGHAICIYGASDRRQAVRLVNSWGMSYPLVWMPYAILERCLTGFDYPGEATVLTDRVEEA